MRRLRRIGKGLLYAAGGCCVLIVVALLGFTVALNRAPHYQAEIKEWVHSQTGYHIGFAQIRPAIRWHGPELYFDRLELRSKDDQRVLIRAAGGRIAVDVSGLLRSGRLVAGRVELDAPNIEIARTGDAAFAVAAEMPLGGADSDRAAPAMEDLPAGTLAIRRGVLTVQNWNPALPRLVVRDVNLDLAKDRDGIVLSLVASLPAALGGAVSLHAAAGGSGELRLAAWNARARVRGISFSGWQQLLPEYLSSLDAGTGTFFVTASGAAGNVNQAHVDFDARDVQTRMVDGPVSRFDEMSGAVTLTHAQDEWTLSGRQVRATRRDPPSAFDASWRGDAAGLVRITARASYLRADTLLPLTALLPQKDLRKRLRDLAPTGEWRDTSLTLTRRSPAEPWDFDVHADFRNAGFAPLSRAPGLRGLNGSLSGTERAGHLFLKTDAAVFTWPTQFLQPVELQTLDAAVYWSRGADELLIASSGWRIQSRDARMQGKLSWQQPSDGSSPLLTFVSTIQNGNVAAAKNYFPRALLAPPALAWLDRALVAGHVPRADALIQGPIKNFPFRDGSGLFLVRAAFENATLDYSPGWPPADKLTATAEFRNEGMEARLGSGRIGGVALGSAEAQFKDFKNGELRITAAAGNDAAVVLNFLRATPLDALTEQGFSTARAQGQLDLNIDILLPFKDFVHRRVLVEGRFENAEVGRAGSPVAASAVSGGFTVDGGQVTRADVHGQLLGGPVQMVARVPRGKLARTDLEFRGTFDAGELHDALSLPAAVSMMGRADWRAILKLAPEPARERSLHISSSLMGVAVDMPAPLDKPAGEPWPASLDIQWPAAGGVQSRFALGSWLIGLVSLDRVGQGWRLAHAALQFGGGEPSGTDPQLVSLGGTLPRLDLGGWLSRTASAKDAKPLAYYMRTARLQIGELDYLGLTFRTLALNLNASDAGLRVAVGGPNVIGTLFLPASSGPNPMTLEFARLHVDSFAADELGESGGGGGGEQKMPANPRAVPAIEFRATDVSLIDRPLGEVRASLVRLEDGIALKQLSVVGPHFSATADGEWRGSNAGTSRIVGVLASSDVQDALKDYGYAEVMQAKDGKLEFDLTWDGAPSADALPEATGQVKLSLDKGQIFGLKPGAGRVLGLVSIAALPRRLSLDFSDLTDKGLAFDTVRGDFDMRGGNAFTDNVLLKGPAGEIGLIGRVGLKNKDYDQTAVVTGAVGNSLSIPVASALVGGPVVGAAVLLFTQVFKQPLKGLARGYYRITGSWDNPTVERIKNAGAAAASAEAMK